jgi:UDP-N-acetylmuramoyl-tripeptide--D-alanyl-D-alanine ligase
MIFDVEHILTATGGLLESGPGSGLAGAVSIDSRAIKAGEVFLALKGPSFDGHAFVAEAAAKGAVSAIVERSASDGDGDGYPEGINIIRVDDTASALGDLASYARRRYGIPLVAVSGSAGKTGTKEMIAAILALSRRVLKTEGNMNNKVGLPLTLLKLEELHEVAVVELGISEAGEMEGLVEIAAPDVALLTNIGSSHLETLGTPEGVGRAKAPLFTGTGDKCTRVVNLDDPLVVKIEAEAAAKGGSSERKSVTAKKSVTYGTASGADVMIKDYNVLDGLKGIEATYDVGGTSVEVRFAGPALSNVINGAAAIAAVVALAGPGADISADIREGLGSFKGLPGRMEVLDAADFTLIDDTYNANPESVSAALKTLGAVTGRKVAVLGEMLELGAGSAEAHREIGRVAADSGVDLLVAIGGGSAEIVEGASSARLGGGLGSDNVYAFDDNKAALKALGLLIKAGDSILVKGSRGAALEEVVAGLRTFGLDRQRDGAELN